jgi:hypothetical protein
MHLRFFLRDLLLEVSLSVQKLVVGSQFAWLQLVDPLLNHLIVIGDTLFDLKEGIRGDDKEARRGRP